MFLDIVSIGTDTSFCLKALEPAFAGHGRPKILKAVQGCLTLKPTVVEFIKPARKKSQNLKA